MKRIVLILALLAACEKDAGAPQTLTIAPHAPKVGLKSTHESHKSSTRTLEVKGEEAAIVSTQVERKQSEVLEVSATTPTKLAVHYETRDEHDRSGGEDHTFPSPVVGKDYVVWRQGDTIQATAKDGAAVSAEEMEILSEDHADLGQVPEMAALITGRSWTRGVAVSVPIEELRELDHSRGATAQGIRTTSATITWTELIAGIATFTAVMHVEIDNASVALSQIMEGTIKLEVARALPYVITMKVTGQGLVKGGRAAGAGLRVVADGTQTITYQF